VPDGVAGELAEEQLGVCREMVEGPQAEDDARLVTDVGDAPGLGR
jgi:hypothetical protein